MNTKQNIVSIVTHDDVINGNVFRVTCPLCGEFTGHRWIPRTKASDAELRCFHWSAPEYVVWEKNREAGDLRRHRAHYDVIVMINTKWTYEYNYCVSFRWSHSIGLY